MSKPLTPKQVGDITDSMLSAGFNEAEIEETLRDQGVDTGQKLTMDESPARTALKVLPPIAGAMIGGAGLPGAARAILPGITSRIPNFVLSGLGQAAGSTAGFMATGVPPKEAIVAGATTGALGGATEGALNLGARLVGSATSLRSSTIGQTLKRTTSQAIKLMFGKPGEEAERILGKSILGKLAEAHDTISPGRLTKIGIVASADQAGVQIPLKDVHDAIDLGVSNAGRAVGRANSIAFARLSSLQKELAAKFPNGTMSPSQADAQLQAFQRDAEMSASRGNPFLASAYYDMKDVLRKSFTDEIEKSLPGSGLSEATRSAHKYLTSIDTLQSFIRDKTPENFVRSLFSGESINQSARAALREFEDQIGTKQAFYNQIQDLSLKREWSSDERGRAFSLFRLLEKVVGRPATKALVLATRPAGNAVAGAAAGTQAFDLAGANRRLNYDISKQGLLPPSETGVSPVAQDSKPKKKAYFTGQ